VQVDPIKPTLKAPGIGITLLQLKHGTPLSTFAFHFNLLRYTMAGGATVVGGANNMAVGMDAVVVGGIYNKASGDGGVVAGRGLHSFPIQLNLSSLLSIV
jgi:hypothetical protein